MITIIYNYLKKQGELFYNSSSIKLYNASVFYREPYGSSHVEEYLYRGQPEELYEGETSGEGAEQPADEIISNQLSGLDGLDPRVQRETIGYSWTDAYSVLSVTYISHHTCLNKEQYG